MAPALPTGRRGQALALGLTLVTAALVWLGIIAPMLDWYGDRAELLRRQQAIGRRMNALIETLPALRQAASGTSTEPRPAAALLPGDNDTLAAASLQQRIDELAVKAGVRIGSEEILPAQPDGMLRSVAVRLTITAPYRSLVSWLLELARSETPMVADDLQLRGPSGKTNGDLPLEANLTVTAWRAATPETSAGKPDAPAGRADAPTAKPEGAKLEIE